MPTHAPDSIRGHRLLQLGVFLFLLGLLVGFAVPTFANPRMGLASHMQGILNGIFLVVLGLVWSRISLPQRASKGLFWLAIYGTFANWAVTLLAAFWGAGRSMPIAALGNEGTPMQEATIDALLVSLSIAMVVVSVLVLWGLRVVPGTDQPAA
jgi:hydroxylaminobenzene mutase